LASRAFSARAASVLSRDAARATGALTAGAPDLIAAAWVEYPLP
jgi:hypothetical protein